MEWRDNGVNDKKIKLVLKWQEKFDWSCKRFLEDKDLLVDKEILNLMTGGEVIGLLGGEVKRWWLVGFVSKTSSGRRYSYEI